MAQCYKPYWDHIIYIFIFILSYLDFIKLFFNLKLLVSILLCNNFFFRICPLILAIIFDKEISRILCFMDPKRLSSANSFWGILQRSLTKLEVVGSNYVLFMDLMKLLTWYLRLTRWSAISMSKCWLILIINQILFYVFGFWTSNITMIHFELYATRYVFLELLLLKLALMPM